MTTEIAVASNGTLAVAGDQHEWTPIQQAAFAHIGIEDAPDADKQVFHHVCQITGLDPFRRQIYMIGRNEKQPDGKYRKKWTIQTGIDGFRVIAEDHPQYAGTLDPEWCGEDGVWRETWTDRRPPVMARVKVLRHDRQHPITLPVRFSEFAATYGASGDLQGQWKTKPAHMIAKVAEAAALRKAFPRQLAGVYTDDEMAHVDNPVRGRRGVVVEQDAQPVTAAELTGRPQPSTRDWDAEITEAAHVRDLDALRGLYQEAKGNREVRERIARIAQDLAAEDQPADAQDAEATDEPNPRDEDRADEYTQLMADEQNEDAP
jgi:phage recombination protein Bet